MNKTQSDSQPMHKRALAQPIEKVCAQPLDSVQSFVRKTTVPLLCS